MASSVQHTKCLPSGAGEHAAALFETNNVITNPQALFSDENFENASGIRLGVQEMTRYGMTEPDFETLAALLSEMLREGENRPAGHWRDEVRGLRRRFADMQYCLD